MGSTIHFDTGIGYVRKARTTPEGYLQAEVVFARDGILEYQTPRGVRKELRLPEENKKALDDFCLKPLTIEHPPLLINAQNAKNYTVGLTDSTAYYDQNTGFVRGVITVFDSEAVELIKSGAKQEVSVGYECEVEHKPGEYQGQRYDAIQKNLRINHVCVTEKGRAGPDVRVLHLDSSDHDVAISINHRDSHENMVSVTRNGVEYTDIPDSFATLAAQEFSRLDALVQEYEALKESSYSHYDSVSSLESERDRLQGRCDHYEMILKPALAILEDSDIHWDDESSEFYSSEDHNDSKQSKSKMAESMMEDEEDYEDGEDNEEEEIMPPPRSRKKKDSSCSSKKKMDEEEEPDEYDDEDLEAMGYEKKTDSYQDLMRTWKEVDEIIPNFSDRHYDSISTVADIQRLALRELKPHFDTATRSDAEIAGAYLAMLEDQQGNYHYDGANQLEQTIAQTSFTYGKNRQDSNSDPRMDAWKQPLSITRQ